MARSPELKSSGPDYEHMISMRRKDGPMKVSHEMPMGKDKKMTMATVKAMVDRLFAGKKS